MIFGHDHDHVYDYDYDYHYGNDYHHGNDYVKILLMCDSLFPMFMTLLEKSLVLLRVDRLYRIGLWTVLLIAVVACAYDRRSTTIHTVSHPVVGAEAHQPEHIWSFRLISAQIPSTKRTGLAWDDDGTKPDPFVRLYLEERMIWESPIKNDTLVPRWNISLPRNLWVKPEVKFRLEIWDRDTIASADPIGVLKRTGLPRDIRLNQTSSLMFEGGATLTLSITSPIPHKGVGISTFEVRPDGLYIVEVERFSPAGRAGIRPGEQIVQIGETRVDSETGAEAASRLSLAAERNITLVVIDSSGVRRNVQLDSGYIWLTM